MIGLGGLATSFGVLYVISSLVRSRGQIAEKRLLKEWGAWPTTIWLRHRSSYIKKPTLIRYHKYFAHHVPDWKQPSEEDEKANFENADLLYSTAVDWLKEQCRDEKFQIIKTENAEYGFRRNLLGMKTIGIGLCICSILLMLFIIEYRNGNLQTLLTPKTQSALFEIFSQIQGLAMLLNSIAILVWLKIVNADWVRQAADQYARALLASCDNLSQKDNS